MVFGFITKPIDWFFTTAPRSLKYIIFLFLVMTLGGLTGAIFRSATNNHYDCTSSGILIDASEFNKCIPYYLEGLLFKWNLTYNECISLPDADDQNWNETVCGNVQDIIKPTVWDGIVDAFQAPITFVSWLMRNENETRAGLFDYLSDPSSPICLNLYDCLDPETRAILNVTSNCSIAKGLDVEGDNFPTLKEFTFYTYKNKTISSQDLGDGGLFSVQCYQFNDDYETELVFLGFPLLRWELWFMVFFIGFLFYIVFKIKNA